MSKVVTFGEIMLRLSPEGNLRFIQADKFDAVFGGGEANVAVSLACLGVESSFVTALPQNPIGDAAICSLRKYGVDTSEIIRSGNRIGIYYLEKGASQRPSKVVYDRAGSSISLATCGDFNWKKIFAGADWFHLTGITPALGKNAVALCHEACRAAKAAGCKISFDPNYRQTLWTKEQAAPVLSEFLKYTDLLITNDGQAAALFGYTPAASETERPARCREMAAELSEKYSIPSVALTIRTTISSDDNNWSAVLYTDRKCYSSKNYSIHIIDRVGGGDSFSAGMLYSFISKANGQTAVDFATAASCLKLTVSGDYNLVTADEVRNLMRNGAGRIKR